MLIVFNVGLILIVVVTAIYIYRIWREHEEHKAQMEIQRRRELESAFGITHDWPPPNGPKGWNGRKKAA